MVVREKINLRRTATGEDKERLQKAVAQALPLQFDKDLILPGEPVLINADTLGVADVKITDGVFFPPVGSTLALPGCALQRKPELVVS